MPSSPAVRMISRAESAPRRCPSMRGRCRDFAQRPLPSMITATWRGRLAAASELKLDAETLICITAGYADGAGFKTEKLNGSNHLAQLSMADGGRLFQHSGDDVLRGDDFLGGFTE